MSINPALVEAMPPLPDNMRWRVRRAYGRFYAIIIEKRGFLGLWHTVAKTHVYDFSTLEQIANEARSLKWRELDRTSPIGTTR